MSGVFGGGGTIAQSETPLSGLQIQSSAYGLAMAFGYGRTRAKPNLLWYGDFNPIPHTSSQSSGGKGGGGVTSTNTTYTYTASLALALGETVTVINRVWIDKAAAEDVNIKFTPFTGPDPQTPWSYLTGAHPSEALGYSGMAYVAASGYDLGARTTLPNHTFDVTLKLPLGGGVDDADPGQILPDLLTNAQYGVTNFPSNRIGDLSQYSAYCRAAGLLLSPLYEQPKAASQIITSLMQLTNSGVFFSEGVLKVTPYGDAALSGHGAIFTPDLTSKADFGEDDFMVSGSEDPVRIKRNAIPETVSGSADAYNQVTLEILDRSQDYRAVPVVAQDMVSIDVIGLRPMATITAHEIADPAVGQAVANLILQRVLNIRATYEWSAGWQWCRLEPTDIVSLTEPALGLDGYPVRILKIEEDGDTGGLKFTAEDVPFGIGHHVTAPLPTLGGYAVDQAIPPGPTNAPVIFEPPNSLTAPDLQLWIAASGGVDWGGCEVWASDDGMSYRRIGIINNPARHGTLTAVLSAGTDPDITHTLAVELGACRGQLLPGTTADADASNTLLWVDGELIAYSAATLTGSHAYSLGGYLRRGIKGTANATHASGAKFARVDDALFRYTVPTARVGSPIWLKFPAFNTLGFALQALAGVTAYQYTFAGNRPLPLTALSATGGMFQINLSWALPATQLDLDYTEIWGSTTNDRATAVLLTSAKHPSTTWVHPGLQPAQTWYYWARVIDTSGNFSDWYPSNALAGVSAAPSSDPSALLTQLINALGLAQLAAELATPINLIPGLNTTVGQHTDALATQILSYDALSNSYVAVQSQATAQGAKYVLQVDSNGHIAGMQLASGSTGSSLIFLADKLLFAMPDGTGTPKQVMVIGTVNGMAALGLDGNLIVDGSIVARHLAAKTVTADKVDGTNLEVMGGSFTGAAWPATGGGFYLGPTGLMIGRLASGQWAHFNADGSMSLPGISVAGGVLTIDQVNVINTLNIAGNAVTIPASAFSAAAAATYNSAGQLLQSVTFTSTGAPVYVSGCHFATTDSNSEGVTTVIFRDAVEVYRSSAAGTIGAPQTGVVAFVDTPGAGAHTYTMYGYAIGGLVSSTNRSLLCLEVKR